MPVQVNSSNILLTYYMSAIYLSRTGGSNLLVPPTNGTVTLSSNLVVQGILSTAGCPVITGRSTSYSIQASDSYIGVNGTGVVLTLPLGSTLLPGKQFVIKDESGTALARPVTINVSDSNLIDGNSSVSLSKNYMALTLLWTGSVWSII